MKLLKATHIKINENKNIKQAYSVEEEEEERKTKAASRDS